MINQIIVSQTLLGCNLIKRVQKEEIKKLWIRSQNAKKVRFLILFIKPKVISKILLLRKLKLEILLSEIVI